jgi:putative SOS response-associated peptidase YedK
MLRLEKSSRIRGIRYRDGLGSLSSTGSPSPSNCRTHSHSTERRPVPASGKQPYYIHPQDADPFALAGLWEHWQGADGEIIESCTIVTTEAADAVRFLHERMPVILQPQDFDLWLDPHVQKPELLQPLLRPFREVAFYPVSTYVNSPRHEGAQCIEPLAA